jgi:sensor c-di-GMP phosphodiesterase-like protein
MKEHEILKIIEIDAVIETETEKEIETGTEIVGTNDMMRIDKKKVLHTMSKLRNSILSPSQAQRTQPIPTSRNLLLTIITFIMDNNTSIKIITPTKFIKTPALAVFLVRICVTILAGILVEILHDSITHPVTLALI